MSSLGKLWTCPECGRKLVGKNMAHSCTDATVADFLRRGDAASREASWSILEPTAETRRCGGARRNAGSKRTSESH